MILLLNISIFQQVDAQPQNNKEKLISQSVEQEQIIVYCDQNGPLLSSLKSNAYYRKILGQTTDGHYIIQNFYMDNQKQSNPIKIRLPSDFNLWFLETKDGLVTIWHRNG